MRRTVATTLAAFFALLPTVGAPAPAVAAPPRLMLGVSGGAGPLLFRGSAAAQTAWMARATTAGVQLVRIDLNWFDVAPAIRPSGFEAADPASAGYTWARVDAAVRALVAARITPVIKIWGAPTWAEGPERPQTVSRGAWRPSPADLTAFATAAATRYGGKFPDPLTPGTTLPHVRFWQGWNEPNLSIYLSPQWIRSGGRWIAEGPTLYRRLENAFYRAVKRVDAGNFVVDAGTAPYGDSPGGQRMPPVTFVRALFCLPGVAVPAGSCPESVYLDALDHHPYGFAGPLQRALVPEDVAVPDYGKLTSLLAAAERAKHVLPKGPKPLWVTEISWDTDPPDPDGVPAQQAARWCELALYVLWRQGVRTVLWWQLGDSPPVPDYASTYQSGIFYLDGRPKPAMTAFHFPFVTRRLGRDSILAWGRAPIGGRFRLETLSGRRWAVLRTLTVSPQQVVSIVLHIRGRATFRATVGSQTSLTWTQAP